MAGNEQVTVTIGGKVGGDLMGAPRWDKFRDAVDTLVSERGFTVYVRNTGTGSWTEDTPEGPVTVTEPNFIVVGVHDEGETWRYGAYKHVVVDLVYALAKLCLEYEQSAIALGVFGHSYLVDKDGADGLTR
jgi:hypothetical protein